MIDSNGKLVSKFPLPFHGREPKFISLRWAETYDMAYDPNNDRIIVADTRNNKIVILNNSYEIHVSPLLLALIIPIAISLIIMSTHALDVLKSQI